MTTALPFVSTPVRPAAPEVLLVGARRALTALAEVLTAAGIRHTSLGGPLGLGAELERRQPLLLAVGDELGPSELVAVGRLAKIAAVPLVALSSSTPGEVQLEAWSNAGVADVILLPVDTAQLLARLALLRKPAPQPTRARSPRTVLVAGADDFLTAKLADALTHNGYQVDRVRDASDLTRQALILNTRMDLLLLADDLLRPGASAALAALRRQLVTPTHEVMVLVADASRSASAAPEVPSKGFSVIAQQTPPDAIVRRIDELLGRTPNALGAQSRVPFFCQLTFREAGGGPSQSWASGYSFSVSPGGIYLHTLLPLRPGAPVELEFKSMGEQLGVTGVVAWSNGFARRPAFPCAVGMGVQFLGALSPGLKKLIDYSRGAS